MDTNNKEKKYPDTSKTVRSRVLSYMVLRSLCNYVVALLMKEYGCFSFICFHILISIVCVKRNEMSTQRQNRNLKRSEDNEKKNAHTNWVKDRIVSLSWVFEF